VKEKKGLKKSAEKCWRPLPSMEAEVLIYKKDPVSSTPSPIMYFRVVFVCTLSCTVVKLPLS
jgi:hypothetical protein